ncbi:class I SAM-dependent methyltransferase [Actinomycetes bacterium M1A6_2h]
MDEATPSRTALATARARADHQIHDLPVMYSDPLVGRLVGGTSVAPMDRPRRLFFAARARFAEDRVTAAVATGTAQVVVLGAGLDTFGLRNSSDQVRVFEVDHPATQAWKRRKLQEAGIQVPTTMAFVPVDFESDPLTTGLATAGFDAAAPAIFVWLGVVIYLTPDALRATLDFVAGRPHPTEVVFDYLQSGETARGRDLLRARSDTVAATGEPFLSYFTPDSIAGELDSHGLAVAQDRSAAELIDSYSAGSTRFEIDVPDQLRASRVVSAMRRRH